MGQSQSINTLSEKIVTLDSEQSITTVSKTSQNAIENLTTFITPPPEGFPTIEGFTTTNHYLAADSTRKWFYVLERGEGKNKEMFFAKVINQNTQKDLLEQAQKEVELYEKFPDCCLKTQILDAKILGRQKKAVLYQIGGRFGIDLMSYLKSKTRISQRLTLIVAIIESLCKLYLSTGDVSLHPIQPCNVTVEEKTSSLQVRFFDCVNSSSIDQKESFYWIAKLCTSILVSDEESYYINEAIKNNDIYKQFLKTQTVVSSND